MMIFNGIEYNTVGVEHNTAYLAQHSTVQHNTIELNTTIYNIELNRTTVEETKPGSSDAVNCFCISPSPTLYTNTTMYTFNFVY